MDAHGPGFAGRDNWPRSIVSGSQDAAMAIGTGKMVGSVDDIEPEECRDPQPMPVDREPLQAVDFGRVGDEQQRPDLTTSECRLDQRGRRMRSLAVGGVEVGRWTGVGSGAVGEVEVLGEPLRHRHLAE